MVSLAQLLREIQESPRCITRDLLAKQFEERYSSHPDATLKSIIESRLVDGDWKNWAGADGSLDVKIAEADLDSLDTLSKELITFASSQIAHTSFKAIGKGTKVTFDAMDASIDFIEKLTIRYRALLTGAGGWTLEPTPQYDWYEQFRFAWRPSQ